jgi:hypothetical protein
MVEAWLLLPQGRAPHGGSLASAAAGKGSAAP